MKSEESEKALMRYVDEVPADETQLFVETGHHAPASSYFDTVNEQAIPVYERAATSFSAQTFTVNSTAQMLVGRRRGRKHVALSCPGTVTAAGVGSTPKGFMFSADRNNLDAGIGFQVNPGDSVTIDSEDAIWVAALPGNTTGVVQYLEVFNALAGPATD